MVNRLRGKVVVPFNHDCIVRVSEDGTVEGDLHVGLESKYTTVREGSEARRTVQSLGWAGTVRL